MDDRRLILLDRNDVVCAAQILGWVAYPHRPEHGVNLLNQWFYSRRRSRGEEIPPLPFDLKKKNRIESQLPKLQESVLDGLRSGIWFNRRMMNALNRDELDGGILNGIVEALSMSTRSLATNRAERKEHLDIYGDTGNEIRKIWTKRKPVLHLALAAGNAIAEAYYKEDRRGFDLGRTVFQPDWLDDVFNAAESHAIWADKHCDFELKNFYKFERDSF